MAHQIHARPWEAGHPQVTGGQAEALRGEGRAQVHTVRPLLSDDPWSLLLCHTTHRSLSETQPVAALREAVSLMVPFTPTPPGVSSQLPPGGGGRGGLSSLPPEVRGFQSRVPTVILTKPRGGGRGDFLFMLTGNNRRKRGPAAIRMCQEALHSPRLKASPELPRHLLGRAAGTRITQLRAHDRLAEKAGVTKRF